eukprot:3528676-Pyramimonas_sp.AAC.1
MHPDAAAVGATTRPIRGEPFRSASAGAAAGNDRTSTIRAGKRDARPANSPSGQLIHHQGRETAANSSSGKGNVTRDPLIHHQGSLFTIRAANSPSGQGNVMRDPLASVALTRQRHCEEAVMRRRVSTRFWARRRIIAQVTPDHLPT